jgi:hypothetical protein
MPVMQELLVSDQALFVGYFEGSLHEVQEVQAISTSYDA